MSSQIEKILISRAQYLKRLIENKRKTLKTAPDGRLRTSISHGSPSFYCVTDPGDTKGKYIPKNRIDSARVLAQKDYDKRIIRAGENELKALDRLIRLQGCSVEDVYDLLSPTRQALVEPVRLTDEEYVRRWLESKACDPMGFDENDPVILTAEGYRVRSKSEQLWADLMESFGVPHVFEPLLYLEGRGWVRPDFAGLNVRKRKEIIIEHLGMMDEIGYSNKNVSKIHDYERNGFILGDNLLITLETKRHPPEAKAIENLIKKHLL